MPVRPELQTEFVRARWSAYVRDLVDSGTITRTRLAALAEVPTSRVKEWIEAERAVEPETAFQIGETLRDASHRTDGFRALYACGYLADLFARLRSLTTSSHASRTSRASALALYCGLPSRMLSHDLRMLDVCHPGERASSSREGVDAYELARLRLAAAAEERRRPFTALLTAEVEAEQRLEDPGIQKILQSNETGSASDLRIDAIPALETPGGVVAAAFVKPTTVPTWLDFLAPLLSRGASTNIRREGSGVILDIAIAVARATRANDPATMTPRLWRMLGEWAYGIHPEKFTRWQLLLPAPYRSYRDDEEQL